MFTGIIEGTGKVEKIQRDGGNMDIWCSSPFTHELKIDQSLSHNGACLTVVEINSDQYRVTAIQETIDKTNLGQIKEGDTVNLERCMPANGRFDGHIVQGHVDQIGICINRKEEHGSWTFTFEYDTSWGNITVEKGSITVNGVSLTVVGSLPSSFSVCIIPYTYEHTNFKTMQVGDQVNLEFDIVGKYVARLMKQPNV
jgi:riboflavin synthase